jgi:S1-C subfamily serine protease
MELPLYVVRLGGRTQSDALFNGTGFLISPRGYVATCWHVVGQAAGIQVHLPHLYERPVSYRVCEKSLDDVAVLESLVPRGQTKSLCSAPCLSVPKT